MPEERIVIAGAIDVSDAIEAYLNRGGNVTTLATTLASAHPTLQSLFGNVVMEFLRIMSEKTYVDARNRPLYESAVAGYRAMVEALNGATRHPYI